MTTSYTLTGDLDDILAADPKALQVYVQTNLASGTALVDLDANRVRMTGSTRVPLAGSMFSIELIGTGSTGTNLADPDALRYTITVTYVDASDARQTWSCANFALTGNLDLSDAVATADPPASAVNVILEQMRELRDEVSEISGLTGEDEAVAALVANPASDTSAAVEAWADVSAAATVSALVPGEVATAVDAHVPGSVLGTATRTAAFTTTSVSPSTTVLMTAPPVVGAGRPVEVRFFVGQARHSVANTPIFAVLVAQKTGSAAANVQIAVTTSPSTSVGTTLELTYLTTIPNGEEWTFAVSITASAAGTTTLSTGNGSAAYLSVISR